MSKKRRNRRRSSKGTAGAGQARKSRSGGGEVVKESSVQLERGTGDKRAAGKMAVARVPLAVFVWGLVTHLAHLRGDLLAARPVGAFFFADGLHFLEKARHLVSGTDLDAALPFHPPFMSWLLAPLWMFLTAPESVYLASKVLMAACNAATYSLIFLLLRRHAIPNAAQIAFLLPLGFGEILMSTVANSEAVYRLLLVLILWIGWRRPILAGALHAIAALTRAEHLIVALAFGGILAWRLPKRRRALAQMAIVGLLMMTPYAVSTATDLRAYNARLGEALPEPLPTMVPVSFYGPLNFALAQTEEDIWFSRRELPVTQNADAALDPTDPTHSSYIVHGYRLGLQRIFAEPGRFAERSVRKLGFSLHALTYGWTWRDLPKGPIWTRRPVDMAYAPSLAYEGAVGLLLILGAWCMRRHRLVLAVGLGLLAYRLAINVAFFPYLRSMMIAAPFATVLLVAALRSGLKALTGRTLAIVIVILGVYQLATAPEPRGYLLAGERDAQGAIIDDRTVRLKWNGHVDR